MAARLRRVSSDEPVHLQDQIGYLSLGVSIQSHCGVCGCIQWCERAGNMNNTAHQQQMPFSEAFLFG
eukprot:scaffold270_cov347-Pavlova_lutheri.AAC.48